MSFDALAPTYDKDFTSRPAAAQLRAQTRERMALHFQPGMHILEIGCGTGADAEWLTARGLRVTATDASLEMRRLTAERLLGYPDSTTTHLDANHLPDEEFAQPFDGVLSNFGALNLLADWHALGKWLTPRVKPGAIVCMAVMTRFCLWESAAALLKGRLRYAVRRWNGTAHAVLPGDAPITIHYPAPRQIQRALSPAFHLSYRAGLGTFLPPSEFFAVIEKRPALFRRLAGWERAAWKRGLGHWASDHVWLEFTRKQD